MMDDVKPQLNRIEAMLKALIDALGYEQDDGPDDEFTLDGEPTGGERDPNQPL